MGLKYLSASLKISTRRYSPTGLIVPAPHWGSSILEGVMSEPSSSASQTNSAEVAARLDELEIKSAYQEDIINQLNDVIVRQQQELERLKSGYQEFTQRLDGLSETLQGRLEDDIPPHY